MRIEYSETEFMPGTTRRRIYLYEDNGDVVMTYEPLYEDDKEDDSEYQYDGPVEEEDSL